MKKIKIPFMLLLFSTSLFMGIGCQNNDETEFQFGDTLTGFGTETVYKAETNGFLNIQFESNVINGERLVIVYSDDTVNPATVIGYLNSSGTTSLPIKKGNFWKVKALNARTINITFVPILN